MKKTVTAFCLILALAILLPACAGTGKTGWSSTEVKQYNETSTSIQAAVGEKFEIMLASNETTGYSWSKNEVYDKAYLELVSSNYIAQKTDRVGAGGTQQYIFKAVKSGSTTIKMTYKRSWESTSSDKSITFNVNIK
jgi:inhibitor of cysteine peptidase